jgi:hypothetical protein
MKFCPVVPEICRGQVHGPRKERRKRIRIIIRSEAKTLSLPNFPKLCLGDLIRNGAKTTEVKQYTPLPLWGAGV